MDDDERRRDEWGAADDSLVREALMSLREDVDHVRLAAPAEVKGRGGSRKRVVWLTTLAGIAAAGAVVAGGGLAGLVPSTASSSTSDPAGLGTRHAAGSTSPPATTDPAGPVQRRRGILPLAQEWQRSLGLAVAPRLAAETATDGSPLCNAPEPEPAAQIQTVTLPGGDQPLASQRVYTLGATSAATAAMAAMVSALGGCTIPGLTLTPASGEQGRISIRGFSNTDGASGWVALVRRGADLTYIELWESTRATSSYTRAQMQGLAEIASERLAVWGSRGSAVGAST